MLEIIVLILLCRKMKAIVAPKGYSAGRWQLYTVLTWVACEFFGVMLSIMFGKDLFIVLLSGLLCAVGGYLLLQQKAKSLPQRSTTANDEKYSNP